MLEDLEHVLQKIRDTAVIDKVLDDGETERHTVPPVIRISAHAALLVIQKYYALTDETEVHRIAIGENSFSSSTP